MAVEDSPFLARWSRRKAQARGAAPLPDASAAPPAAVEARAPPAAVAAPTEPERVAPPQAPPALTLDDVARLTRESDYSAFVARDVPSEVHHAALKKLFTDPHFNVMDGLDTYIEDYGKPDPLPPGMLRQMVQSRMLGLFSDEALPAPTPECPPATVPAPALADADPPPALLASADPQPLLPDTAAHEDADLQLQPDDDAGRAGAEPGAGQDARRQH